MTIDRPSPRPTYSDSPSTWEDFQILHATMAADPKGQVQVTVTAIRCEGLASEEGLALAVRLGFEGQTAADSGPIELAPGAGAVADVQHSSAFDLAVQTSAGIQVVLGSGISVFLQQVVREKKKKGDTLLPLGEATVALLPLLYDGNSFTATVNISAVLQEGGHAPAVPVEVDVIVSVKSSVLSVRQRDSGNLLTMSAAGMFSLPDSFTPATAASHTMVVTATLPGDRVLALQGGVVVAPTAHQCPLDPEVRLWGGLLQMTWHPALVGFETPLYRPSAAHRTSVLTISLA